MALLCSFGRLQCVGLLLGLSLCLKGVFGGPVVFCTTFLSTWKVALAPLTVNPDAAEAERELNVDRVVGSIGSPRALVERFLAGTNTKTFSSKPPRRASKGSLSDPLLQRPF